MRGHGSRTAFFCVLCGACLLLLLCCLLETPSAEDAANRAPVRGVARAWIAPLPANPDSAPDAPRAERTPDAPRAPLPGRGVALPCLRRMRDANGHILREKRYVDSVYLAFRQEDACG